MKYAHDIIRRPIISEKSMSGIGEKKYTFEVSKDANKIEIKNAVETVFKALVGRFSPLERWNTVFLFSASKPTNAVIVCLSLKVLL